MLWKANIDIQFVAESSLALAHYVSGYVTKAERSSMQEIWQEVSENKSVYSRLWSFGVRSLRSRECGLYEASDLLLGDHLTEKSATVKWIDVSMPQKRSRRLKDHKQLEELANHNPDTMDIYEESVLATHYPRRPASLEDVCLYDLVANYDWQSRDDDGDRKYTKLKKPRLPNHKLFDPQKENQREDYFYSLILLFVPFRDESSLLLDNETAEEAFHRLMNEDSSAYHEKLQKILDAQSKITEINEARRADGEEKRVNKEDDDPQLMGEAKNAMHDMEDMLINHSSDQLSFEDRKAMLNADQRRIFDSVDGHLQHQKQHETGECQCDFRPLRMFVSGVGGTGKSFLIEAIKLLVGEIWPSKEVTVAVAAPTGLAAFNVGGLTIHRLFQLPVEHEGKSDQYWSLSKASQKVMKTKLRSVKLIVVDEISMVSSLTLTYMHLRLEELFGGDEWFGCRNMIFVGDLLQLQPVNGNPVLQNITQKALLHKLGCTASVNIWRDSVTYDELTINERQKSDAEFATMLDCVRRGCPTDETISTLQQRVIQVAEAEKFNDLQKLGQTPVCLFPTREMCKRFNIEMLNHLSSEVHEIVCTDEVDQTSSTKKWNKKALEQLEKLNNDCSRTAGLEAKLLLAVGARVMLRRNIETKTGLVNGALGTILSISSESVNVKFDHVTEPYDVDKVQTKFMVMKNFYVYREQFPLILAYAVTIHKCQGLSLDCAIVDLSDKVFSAGMAYVALSRVRSLAGLHLSAFDPKSIIVSTDCLQEANRLREAYRKDLPLYQMPSKVQPSSSDRKRKLTGNNVVNPAKRVKLAVAKAKKMLKKPLPKQVHDSSKTRKRSQSPSCDNGDRPNKKPRTSEQGSRQVRSRTYPFRFHHTDEAWQRTACRRLGVEFVRRCDLDGGGPNVPLTRPRRVRHIVGDGNCLFRSFSYLITGTERQHAQVRAAILNHLRSIEHLMLPHISTQYSSVTEYINDTNMDRNGTWATDIEILTLAHMLNTCVYVYDPRRTSWDRYGPHGVDRTLTSDITDMSMFIRNPTDHFDVVCSIFG